MPIASIIIPCRQEKKFISTCLDNVISFKNPKGDFEIIVVDGMSTDGTREIIQEYKKKDQRIKMIDNPSFTVSHAMNLGIQEAKGEYIVRIDVHTEYAKDYVVKCLETIKQTKADNVGGPARTKANGTVQKAIAAAYHSKFSVGGAKFHDYNYEGCVDTVTYGCYKRAKLIEIGLYDEELVRNQDDELNLRLIRSGGKIWQSPEIKSWYYPRDSLLKLFKQYMQYGYWKVRVIQKHKIPASFRHLVPGLFVLFLIGGWLLSLLNPFIRLVWLWVILFYLMCNLLASLWTAYRSELKLLPVLPFVFITYHVSYGYGFLHGIIDFIIFTRNKLQKDKFKDLSR